MLAGQTYINPNLGARLAAEPDAPDGPPDELTPREIEVLGLLALGYMNPEIADKLVLSVRTVRPIGPTSTARQRSPPAPS